MTQQSTAASALNAPRLVADRESEIETFLARGETLYQRQRTKLLEQDRTYQQDRFHLLYEFDKRAQALVNEREDALRAMDTKHARIKAEGERVLAALATLRDG